MVLLYLLLKRFYYHKNEKKTKQQKSCFINVDISLGRCLNLPESPGLASFTKQFNVNSSRNKSLRVNYKQKDCSFVSIKLRLCRILIIIAIYLELKHLSNATHQQHLLGAACPKNTKIVSRKGDAHFVNKHLVQLYRK